MLREIYLDIIFISFYVLYIRLFRFVYILCFYSIPPKSPVGSIAWWLGHTIILRYTYQIVMYFVQFYYVWRADRSTDQNSPYIHVFSTSLVEGTDYRDRWWKDDNAGCDMVIAFWWNFWLLAMGGFPGHVVGYHSLQVPVSLLAFRFLFCWCVCGCVKDERRDIAWVIFMMIEFLTELTEL